MDGETVVPIDALTRFETTEDSDDLDMIDNVFSAQHLNPPQLCLSLFDSLLLAGRRRPR